MIGVLIAVAASAAWEHRHERQVESASMREMRVALTVDIEDTRLGDR